MRSLTKASVFLGAFVTRLSGRTPEESHGNDEVFLSVNTDAREGNVSSPFLYGAMFEVSPIPIPFLSIGLSNSTGNGPLRRWRNPCPTPPQQRLPRLRP